MHLLFAALLALTQQWLVTGDLHVNPFDRSPGVSGYGSDTNWPLFRSAIEAMRRANPDPDVVVIAGDLLAHQWSAKARSAGQDPAHAAEQTMARIAKQFDAAFPRAQFLLALGNNDDPCGDYRTGPDTGYLAAVARVWAPLVNRRNAAPGFARNFAYAGYYTAALPGRTRAVVLDDVYWSLFFRACGRGQNVAAQEMKWFDRTLGSLKPGERAVPVMHIPPGVDPAATLIAHRFVIIPFWRGDLRGRFISELDRFGERVPFAIAAHTHRSDFRLLGKTPMLVAPAISPIYSNNPSFAELRIGAGDALENYQAYSYDLEAGTWSQTFDFDKAFHASAFSADGLALVHDRIAQDDETRARWEHSTVGNSDAWYSVRYNWRAYWCAQTETRAGYSACAGDQRRTLATFLALGAAGAVVVVLVVWYSRRRWKRRGGSGA